MRLKKPRRLIVSVEIESSRTIKDIKDELKITGYLCGQVKQIQVNVIRKEK